MQIAASGANFIRKEHVPAEVLRRELDIYRSQAAATGKPSPVVAKIVEGKLGKFYEEVCLYEQSFIKDQTLSISQLIASAASNLREKIAVRRFVRFKVGENNAAVAINEDWRTEGGEASGVTANKPKVPKAGSGFAAAKLDSDVE